MTVFESIPETFPAEKTAVALGIFDGLHKGHMAVLKSLIEASKPDGLTPLVFTFDTNESRPGAKTPKRLLSDDARNEILLDIGVEYVLSPKFSEFRDMQPHDFSVFLTRRLNAKAVFCGEDFRFGKGAKAGALDLEAFLEGKSSVHVIKTVAALDGAVSSTRIKQLLESGDIAAANTLLGRPFPIKAPVIRGRGIGLARLLQTANQPYPPNLAVPRFGVYASETAVGDKRYASVTNIGVKPTVGIAPLLAETHIFDFSADLYGETISVSLLEFIRDEKKFDSLELLKAQMEKDSASSRKIYNNTI